MEAGNGPRPVPGFSREAEEAQLKLVIQAAQENLEKAEQNIRKLSDDLDDLREIYGTKDKEALALFHNTHAQISEQKRNLLRCQKARKKPYFGRIDFKDSKQPYEESYYVGRVGIAGDGTQPLVIDWRAPVASVYYENAVGPCRYTVKQEGAYEIDLKRKRTYEIEEDRLKDFYDSDVVANDELLTQYLAKNKKAVLGEIIATIQKEQNAIIRQSPKTNLIVQGVAGSGKTTVAMHRISYILYNYESQFRPQDFYIIGSNRILLNYITGVLPDLDVYGVLQMTMEEMFARLLYEDWDPRCHQICPVDKEDKNACRKGSSAWFHDLERFCRQLEYETVPQTAVSIPKNGVPLLDGPSIRTYLEQNPQVSIQGKVNMLNQMLLARLENELSGKHVSYTAAEKKELRRTFGRHFGGDSWKGSIFEAYRQFLEAQAKDGKAVPVPGHTFDVYDLAALAYLYKRIKETDGIREASHVIIDEAQDFGMMAYHALAYCLRGCTYTVMGDVSQNIYYGYGLDDWRELQSLLLTGTYDHFGLLKKSYRNTVEISRFATEILRHGNFPAYPVEPIQRHGNKVCIKAYRSEASMLQGIVEIIQAWQAQGRETAAVICRDEEQAQAVKDSLSGRIPIAGSSLETTDFGNGVMVLPVAYAKGLEFDAVLLYNPSSQSYPAQDAYVKRLYVAATRALHELAIVHLGDLTGLISDPVPQKKRMQSLEYGMRKDAIRYQKKEQTAREQELQKAAQGETERALRSKMGPRPVAVPQTAPGTSGIQRMAAMSSAEPAAATSSVKPAAANAPKTKQGPANTQGIKPRPGLPGQPAAKPAVQSQAAFFYTSRKTPACKPDSSVAGTVAGRQKSQEGKNTPINQSPYRFGACPDNSLLRPKGHGHIDHSVRIVRKTETALELISNYGLLRLTPATGDIIHVQFKKTGTAEFAPSYWDYRPVQPVLWNVKEGKKLVEATTEKLIIRIDRKTGAVQFFTKQNKLLLAEKAALPRQVEQNGALEAWTYFEWQRSEKISAKGIGRDDFEPMGNKARYISFGGKKMRMPLLYSEYGYGIGAAATTAICCTIPMYGQYLYTQGSGQADYYFLYGGGYEGVLALYKEVTK